MRSPLQTESLASGLDNNRNAAYRLNQHEGRVHDERGTLRRINLPTTRDRALQLLGGAVGLTILGALARLVVRGYLWEYLIAGAAGCLVIAVVGLVAGWLAR